MMVIFIIISIVGYFVIPAPDNWNYIFIGMAGLFISFMARSMAGTGIIEPKFTTLSDIHCNNADCGYQKYKIFKIGDYINKIIEKCKNCKNGSLKILNIIQLEEKNANKLLEGEKLEE